ncbi:acyltransferase family protein [Pseudomonas sp. D1-2]|uniref:acyltransferase family protein n=1 Tax=unclassified Pseudomonas TaxID=196821 RepID=UPI003DA9180F
MRSSCRIGILKSLSYFDSPGALAPILHTWSLSVEEQFYFVFPAMLLCVMVIGKRLLLPLVVIMLACSLCYSVYLMSDDQKDVAFYNSVARFWEILVGVVLATIRKYDLSRGVENFLECVGVGLIVTAIIAFGHDLPFPGMYALVPTIGAALLILTKGNGVVTRILASKPMVSIGLVSYALYLWHWPLMAAVRVLDPTPAAWLMTIILLISGLLAWLSYIFIERPIRSKRIFSGKAPVWSCALIVVVGSYAAGAYFTNPKAVAHQETAYAAVSRVIYPDAKVEILDRIEERREFYMQAMNLNFNGKSGEFDETKFKFWTCSFDFGNTASKLIECLVKQSGVDNVLVMGDSVGRDTTHALRIAFPNKNFIMLHQSSCPPGTTKVCFKEQQKILSALSSQVNVSAVVMSFRYRPSDYRSVEAGIVEAKKVTPNVYLFGLSPMFSLPLADYLKSLPLRAMPSATISATDKTMLAWKLDELLSEAKKMADRHGIKFVNVLPFFCEDQLCTLWVGKQYGEPLYFDQLHLTAPGIQSFSSYLRTKPELADFL